MESLALNGGPRSIQKPAPHFEWPVITERTTRAVLEQLKTSISIYDRSGIIDALERRLEQELGIRHALLFNSGTSALTALYAGAALSTGEEVICPAYTFFATASPLFFMGATPVLCDCGDDGNIDPDAIEDLITPRSRAIIVTHMWGLPCDMERITAIARKHGLKVFEDISHAYGAMYKGAPVGTLSNAAALSLQGQKTLTGGEGGVLLTDDDEIFYRALAFGHYNKRCQKEIPEGHRLREFAVTGMGLKLRIHPIAAAIALEQLESIPNVMQGRQRCADIMTGLLSDVPEISLPRPSAHVQHGWYAYLIQLQGALVERSKDVLDAAHAEGLAELDQPRSTAPLHHYALFRNPSEIFPNWRPPASIAALPTADALYRRALKLPVWHREEDFELAMQYARGLRKVLRHFGDRA